LVVGECWNLRKKGGNSDTPRVHRKNQSRGKRDFGFVETGDKGGDWLLSLSQGGKTQELGESRGGGIVKIGGGVTKTSSNVTRGTVSQDENTERKAKGSG